MLVYNELVEFVTAGEPEYEEIIEEYEEEVLVQEGASEPPSADFADTRLSKASPVHNIYFEWSLDIYIHIYIYIMLIYVTGILWKLHA